MKIVTVDQMRQIEALSEKHGVSTDTLMENAGLEVARRVRRHAGYMPGTRVVVLVGGGNNGADGLVAARHLHAWGARVLAYLVRSRVTPDPKLEAAQQAGVPIARASEDERLARFREALASASVVVDAVLGTGRVRPIEGILKDIFAALASIKAERGGLLTLALDLPSGLNADTGEVDPATPEADVTVALGYPKVGLFLYPGADKVGRLEIADIGIPWELDADVTLSLMTPSWAKSALPERPSSSHKGTFGRTLIVAGSRSYIGAAYLAATAATRVGAGLVTIAIPESLKEAVASKATEPVYLPLPESSPGVVSPDAIRIISESLPGQSALVIGCGLGQHEHTQIMVERLLLHEGELPPTVVDADGLNTLAEIDDWWRQFPGRAILTPHPGEMARLTRESTGEIQRDRITKAVECAMKWNKVVTLKGAYTVVAFPDGRAMLSPFANPGLASAGTGDVLAGVIGGLLSQGLTMEDAAALGVYLHGAAGERVREELGEAGMIASDLLPVLPKVIKGLRNG